MVSVEYNTQAVRQLTMLQKNLSPSTMSSVKLVSAIF